MSLFFFQVTTHLENLEKSGNCKEVGENERSQGDHSQFLQARNVKHIE